jgi:protocatechuate 3,4-dioxygenase beta subunit
MKLLLSLLLFTLLVSCRTSQARLVGGGCDGCDLMFQGMPAKLNPETALTADTEPGEPMEISGTIYRADGKTPAAGVILYVYQTSAKGYYEPAPGATRHGRIRGWMKTDVQGHYKFRTVRPGAYPGRNIPAHIHPVVKEPDKNEYYLDEYRFDDDPHLTAEERAREEKRGGSGIIKLAKNQSGVWSGRRDIILGLNIPNYR